MNAAEAGSVDLRSLDVTIMITTRNRVSELVKTLETCRTLSGITKEVLVVDDTSSDGTYETVRERFPEVEIVRNEVNKGSIASRNRYFARSSVPKRLPSNGKLDPLARRNKSAGPSA